MKGIAVLEEIVLPIGKPFILGYQHHANPLSVLACDEDYLTWLYCNYIQLFYDPRSITYFNFYFNGFVPNFFTVSNPLLDIQILKKESVFADIVDYVFYLLSSGKYFETSINEYYIKSRSSYLVNNFDHEILVYGCNIKDKYFCTLGYDRRGLYSAAKISFEDFETAYKNTGSHPYSQMIRIYERKKVKGKKYVFKFDIQLVHMLLSDYLSAYNTSERLRMIAPPLEGCLFGVEACKKLLGLLENLLNGSIEYDIRPFHILWEHKTCMVRRINYMIENEYLPCNKDVKQFENIENDALNLKHMLIKWSISRNNMIIKKMISVLMEMIEKEYKALSNVLLSINIT